MNHPVGSPSRDFLSRLRKYVSLLILIAAGSLSAPCHALPPLQLFIELTPPGGTLKPPAGDYAGPAEITKPLVLDGQGQVTLDGGGDGTVLSILADGVTVRGMHITNSGGNHDDVDAGILIQADNILVENNRIDESLFGIHFKNTNDSIVRDNHITSFPVEPSLRGDGIRMWYSNENRIENNTLTNVRDLLLTNSADNHIVGNQITGSRVGIEFIFSPGNLVENNSISRNGTGIVVLYSNELEIRGNHLEHMWTTAGMALALKESSEVLIEGNRILHCTIGMGANAPTHPENVYRIENNHFVYNDVALYFYGAKGGHIVQGNQFDQNHKNVLVSAPTAALNNQWAGNRWDDNEGFDLDGDGSGDRPHEIYLYSDRIWIDRPMTKFFRGSPLLELIDFAERLAPFSAPELILSDTRPKVGY